MNKNVIDESTQKVQYALYGVTGSLYKQGFAKNYKSAFSIQKRHSKVYGGYLSMKTEIVPISQSWKVQMPLNLPRFCFCPETPIYVNKCTKCGLSPYTE